MACVNIASGLNKVISYKKEDVCWGDLPSLTTGAKTIRRVSGNFNLSKETYQSEEIRVDHQMADMRHGVRSVEGSISGELAPNAYTDFLQAGVSRDFAVVAPVSGLTVDIAITGAPLNTITRSTGDWLASGIKTGSVIRLTGGTLNAANINKNLLVVSMTALVLTVVTLNKSAMFAQTAVATVTATVAGKTTYVPSTGHTDDSFSFEEWYSDIAQSEVSTGNKVNTIGLSLPATGLVTTEIAFMGKDIPLVGTSQYFTSPTAQGEDKIFASVSGALVVNGQVVDLVTSLSININRNLASESVVGRDTTPDIEVGRILVDGEFSTLFANGTYRDMFRNEDEVALIVALTTGSQANAPFMTFTMPRIKVNSDSRDDGEKSIVSSNSFQALKGSGTGGFQATTIQIQDSSLV